MRQAIILAIIAVFSFFSSTIIRAAGDGIVITEIMYAPEGTQSGREWFEVKNTDSVPISFSEKIGTAYRWRLIKGGSEYPISPSGDSDTLQPGEFAVVSADPAKLLETDLNGFSGMIFRSGFGSLNDIGDTLSIKDRLNEIIIYTVTYLPDWGAKKDGNSLQLVGSQWVAGLPTPGAPPSGGSSQTQQLPLSSGESVVSSQPSSLSSGNSSLSEIEKIHAFAGSDLMVVAGSNAEFSGSATGVKGEPLTNARFWWNFGNGETKEGRVVNYTFQIPGRYTVGLHVSSGEYSASDYAAVEVIPNQFSVSRVLIGETGFAVLKNDGQVTVDIGGWVLEDATGKSFIIPLRTVIGSKSEIVFANSITGILFKGPVLLRMRYPNLSLAFSWEEKVKVVANNEPPAVLTKLSESAPASIISQKSEVVPATYEDADSHESAVRPQEEKDLLGTAAVSKSIGPSSFIFFTAAVVLGLAAAAGFLLFRRG